MNSKNRPVPDREPPEYICPSASWGDMTGLIPCALNDDSEINSYENIYPYLPHGDNLKN